MTFYVDGTKRRKSLQNVAHCRKKSLNFVTFVADCRAFFFAVPFPPSPFGFRRVKDGELAQRVEDKDSDVEQDEKKNNNDEEDAKDDEEDEEVKTAKRTWEKRMKRLRRKEDNDGK